MPGTNSNESCYAGQACRDGLYLGARWSSHLCRATGGVDEADSAWANVWRIQSTNEELIVCAMNGIPALESQHIHAAWQRGAHLCWCCTREHTLWARKASYRAACASETTARGE